MKNIIHKMLALSLFATLLLSSASVSFAQTNDDLFKDPLKDVRTAIDQERNELVQIQKVLQQSIVELQETLSQVNKILNLEELPASGIYEEVLEDIAKPLIETLEKDILEEVPYYDEEDIDLEDVIEHEREFLEYLREHEAMDTAKFEEQLNNVKTEEDFHKYISQFEDTEFDEVMPDEYEIKDAVERERAWLKQMQKEHGWDISQWLERLDEVEESGDWEDFDEYIWDMSKDHDEDEDDDRHYDDDEHEYDYHEERYQPFSEDLDEAKAEAQEFLESISDKTEVKDILDKLNEVNSWEDFEELGENVSPEIEQLYREMRPDEHYEDDRYEDNRHYDENEHDKYENDEWDHDDKRHYDDYREEYERGDHRYDEEDNHEEPSLEEQKGEIREFLESAGEEGKALLPKLDAATSIEDLEKLEDEVPQSLIDKFEEEYEHDEHRYKDRHEDDRHEDDRHYDDYRDKYERDDHRYDDENDDEHDRYGDHEWDHYDEGPDGPHYPEEWDEDDLKEHHENFDENDPGADPDEYWKTVDQLVEDLESQMEDGKDVDEYFDELENARNYGDLLELKDKIEN